MVTACFQHPDRPPEISITVCETDVGVHEIALCRNCRHAAALAALVYEDIIGPDYEIVAIDEWIE